MLSLAARFEKLKAPKSEEASDQVAGHGKDEKGRSRLFFDNEEGKVWKLYDETDERAKCEQDFYNDVKKNCADELFGKIIPTYYETKRNHTEEGADAAGDYIIMENTFFSLKKYSDQLCLADMKIGQPISKYDREATKHSSEFYNNACREFYTNIGMPDLKNLGYVTLGLKYRTDDTFKWDNLGKYFGRAVSTANDRAAIFQHFLQGTAIAESGVSIQSNHDGFRRKIISDLLAELQEIEAYFEKQTRYQFLGSSLILTYVPSTFIDVKDQEESAYNDLTSQNLLDNSKAPRLAKVRLVDFNNARTSTIGTEGKLIPDTLIGTIDEASLKGIRNIINLIKDQLPKENVSKKLYFLKLEALRLKITGENLDNLDWSLTGSNKSDPYFKLEQNGETIYQSERIDDNLNPKWKKVDIICNSDDKCYGPMKVLDTKLPVTIQVWDYDSGNKDDLIGEIKVENIMNVDGNLKLQRNNKDKSRGILKIEAEILPYYVAKCE